MENKRGKKRNPPSRRSRDENAASERNRQAMMDSPTQSSEALIEPGSISELNECLTLSEAQWRADILTKHFRRSDRQTASSFFFEFRSDNTS